MPLFLSHDSSDLKFGLNPAFEGVKLVKSGVRLGQVESTPIYLFLFQKGVEENGRLEEEEDWIMEEAI